LNELSSASGAGRRRPLTLDNSYFRSLSPTDLIAPDGVNMRHWRPPKWCRQALADGSWAAVWLLDPRPHNHRAQSNGNRRSRLVRTGRSDCAGPANMYSMVDGRTRPCLTVCEVSSWIVRRAFSHLVERTYLMQCTATLRCSQEYQS
jgi:hypothetical protein